MRIWRKTIVLAFTAFGAYRAWELLRPKLDRARDRAATARDHIEPALWNAKESVEDASRDAAASLANTSKDAVGTVADATSAAVDSTLEESNASEAAASPAPADSSSRGTVTP